MAGGPSTVALAAAAAEGGVFPFLAGAYLTPESLRDDIVALRATTPEPACPDWAKVAASIFISTTPSGGGDHFWIEDEVSRLLEIDELTLCKVINST